MGDNRLGSVGWLVGGELPLVSGAVAAASLPVAPGMGGDGGASVMIEVDGEFAGEGQLGSLP